MHEKKQSLNPKDIAHETGKSTRWVLDLCQKGLLPHDRLSDRTIVIDREEWERFKQLRRITAEQAAARAAERAQVYK